MMPKREGPLLLAMSCIFGLLRFMLSNTSDKCWQIFEIITFRIKFPVVLASDYPTVAAASSISPGSYPQQISTAGAPEWLALSIVCALVRPSMCLSDMSERILPS
jgi:hypothetical protein